MTESNFRLPPEQWALLRRLLGEALDLPSSARGPWLDALREEHAPFKERLRALLSHAEDAAGSVPPLGTLPKMETADFAPRHPETERCGELVGPYRLLSLIGEGGMATVWLAERIDWPEPRRVALKLPRGAWQRAGLVERFARERAILAALEHPNIARLYDAGIDASGQPYLALEYIDGQPIDAWCRAQAADVKTRVRVFVQAARAVAYAHTRLVLHRDLKPSQILITADRQAHLLDFGVAKLLEDGGAHETHLTQLGGRALTPEYASPEQIQGLPLTAASDVYSLGVVLFELLTGERPYKLRRDSRGALEDAIVALDAPPPSAVVRDHALRHRLSGDLDTIVLKALKKRPADRYATVDALVDDLERLLDGRPVHARPDSAWYRAHKFVARNALAVAAASSVAVALLGGAGVATWQARVARAEATRAREINQFVLSLFESVDPMGRAGSDLRAVDLLKQARQRIEEELAGRPELQVQLLVTVGKSLVPLGALDDAQETLQGALDIAAHLPASFQGGQDAAIALSDLLVLRGDHAKAAGVIDKWEATLRAQRPSLQLAELLDNRAMLFVNTSRAKAAVPIAQEALDIARQLDDVPRLELAFIVDALARVQYNADQNAAALSSELEALALFESSGRRAQGAATRARALIARILQDLGRIDEAATLLGAELPRLREIFGTHGPDYLINLAEYAAMQNRRGDLATAAASIDEALRVARDEGISARSLFLWERLAGVIALQQRDLGKAREHFARSLEHAAVWRGANATLSGEMLLWQVQVLEGTAAPMPASLRPVRADAAKGLTEGNATSLAVGVLCTAGHRALVEKAPSEALASFDAAAGLLDHVSPTTFAFLVPWCLHGRAQALMETGALDTAAVALDQAMQHHESKSAATSPPWAETLVLRAQLALRRGQINEALADARQADAFWKAYRPLDLRAGEAAVQVGRALIAAGDVAAGRREVRRGEALRAASQGASRRDHATAG